jgi:hypothetical protein
LISFSTGELGTGFTLSNMVRFDMGYNGPQL